jgi:hypothetical protein
MPVVAMTMMAAVMPAAVMAVPPTMTAAPSGIGRCRE